MVKTNRPLVVRPSRLHQQAGRLHHKQARGVVPSKAAARLPTRPTLARVFGSALGMTFSEAQGVFLPALIGIGAALVGAWPPEEGEIKKPFRATARAKRPFIHRPGGGI